MARKVAMALVIDSSGSMGHSVHSGQPVTKLALALRSALETAKALHAEDDILVIAFSHTPSVVIPLGPAGRPQIAQGIRGLQAGGLTHAYPALERAQAELQRSQAAVKHIVVITDGEFSDHIKPFPELVRRVRRDGITISAIGIASASTTASTFRVLKNEFADLGGGRYIETQDPSLLPRILVAEVERIAGPGPGGRGGGNGSGAGGDQQTPGPGRSAPHGPPAPDLGPDQQPKTSRPLPVYRVTRAPMLAGLPADPLPPILGVVPSRARPGAAVLLAAGEAGTPLLTVWNVGLGRVACWSSSADAAWIGPWLEHEKFPAFVAQWVTDCLPPALEPGCLADHDGFQTRVHLVKPLADSWSLRSSSRCQVPRSRARR
jgi:hypothetical protein